MFKKKTLSYMKWGNNDFYIMLYKWKWSSQIYQAWNDKKNLQNIIKTEVERVTRKSFNQNDKRFVKFDKIICL